MSDANAVLTVDLDAITANWLALDARTPGAECAGVVKADGYGLGAVPVARTLHDVGCRRFFVATLPEAIALRAALPDAWIAAMGAPVQGLAALFHEHRITAVLSSDGAVEAWTADGGGQPVWLQLDTGMTRLGLDADAAEAALKAGKLQVEALMSHLGCADEPANPMNEQQRTRFARLRELAPGCPGSLAASSGIFLGPGFHHDVVRPGAALYGINPTPGQANPMRPTVRLAARILQLRRAADGARVGYGATGAPPPGALLATVGLGYADGFLRRMGSGGAMSLDGHRLPLVGRVSMDLIVVDASSAPPHLLREGAWVEAIGPAADVDGLADACGTIGYEILTSLGARLERRYARGAGRNA